MAWRPRRPPARRRPAPARESRDAEVEALRARYAGHHHVEYTDDAIDAHIAQAQKLPSTLSLMHLYPIDGAVRRVGKRDTAWNTRDATWSMVIAGIDPNPQKAGEITRWTKGYWEAVHPYSADGGYVNFMAEGEGQHDFITDAQVDQRLWSLAGYGGISIYQSGNEDAEHGHQMVPHRQAHQEDHE